MKRNKGESPYLSNLEDGKKRMKEVRGNPQPSSPKNAPINAKFVLLVPRRW